MLKGHKIKSYIIMTVLLIGMITGVSIALTTVGEGVFTGVSITPAPIKLGSSSSIQYTLSQNSYVTIQIYDQSDNLVKTLLNNISKTAGTLYQSWDGKDSNGVLVPDGSYRIFLEANDSAGTLTGQVERFVTAARQPSISGLSVNPDPFNPLNGEQAVIDYTISSDALVTVTILKGVTPVRTIITNELKTAGSYTINWDGKDDTGNYVSDAVYSYQIDAVSPLVATFKSTAKSNVTVEKENPSITGLNATPDPMKLSTNNLSITYTLSENAKITTKILDSTGQVVQVVQDSISKNAGYNTASWNGKNSLGNYVPEGIYTAVVSAVDNYNKPSQEYSKSITAGYQPAISGVSDFPDPINPAIGERANINYTISKDALVTVTILKGTTVVKTLAANELKAVGSYTVVWDGTDDAGNLVGDAQYFYQIDAVSPTVPAFKSTSKLNITVEKEAPQIIGLTASPNPMKLATNTLSSSYTLSENSKVTVKVFDSVGNLVQTIQDGVAKNSGYNTASWNGKDSIGNYVPEGNYSVKVNAIDNFNKPSVEQTVTVTAGYHPAISGVSVITTPFNPINGESAVINYTISRDANVFVSILNGATVVRTLAANELKLAGTYNIAWDGKDEAGNFVGDESYTYQIDASSPTVPTFKSTNKGTVVVEGRNPELTALSTTPTLVKIGYTATLRYTLSEPATVNIQIINSLGQVVRNFPTVTKTNSGAYTQSWDTKDDTGNYVESDAYTLKITATDNFNKTGIGQFNFQCITTPVIMDVVVNPQTVDVFNQKNGQLSYRVSERAYVTIKVYDANNVLYNTLANNKDVTSEDTIIWDGANSNGQKISGTYTIKIDANSYIGGLKAKQVVETMYVTNASSTQGKKCTDCHTTYPATHNVSNCVACHGNNEPIEDCRSCHFINSHDAEPMLGKFECTYCHTASYSYKVPQHPAGDNDEYHRTTTSMSACSTCHIASLSLEHSNRTNPATGQPYDCNTCHNSTRPDVQQAIADKQKNCDACHTLHPAGTADHENSQFTAVPKDADMNCALCHNSVISDEHINRKDANGVSYSCDTCHGNTRPEVQSAITNQNKNCEACHINPSTNTPTFHTSASSPTHDTTFILSPDVNCANCHSNNIKSEHLNNAERTTANGQPVTCETCHSSTNQAVKDAIAASNTKCSACHTYPTTKHQPTHATTVFTNDVTRTDSCVTCHNTTNLQTLHVGKVTTAGVTMDCNTCHNSDKIIVLDAIRTKQTASCEACHIVHDPKDVNAVHDTNDVFAATTSTDCATCHERNVKKEHVDNPDRKTSTGEAITCATCHSSTNQMVIDAITSNNTRCDACHTMPPAKHNPTHTASVFTSDNTRTDLATCSLCHVKSLTNQHVGKVTIAGVTMDCKTCHSTTAAANVKQAIADKNDNCEACHTVHAPQTAVTPHDSTDVYVDNTDVNCANCHNRNVKAEHIDNPARTTATGQPITCDTCHGNTDQVVKDAIAASNDKCSACHTYPNTKHQPTHAATVFTNDPSRTDSGTCVICHGSTNLQNLHVGKVTTTGATMDCNTCHASTTPAVVTAISTKQTASCEACHILHAPKDATVVHDTNDVFAVTTDTDCATCHERNVKKEHVDNPARTTSTGEAITCNTCHSSTRAEVIEAINTNNTKCDACHTLPPTKHNPSHTASVFTNDTTRTDLATCSLCHVKSLTGQHVGKVTTAGVTMDCKTCHSSTAATNVKQAIADKNDNCEACHTIHAPQTAVAPHNSTAVYVDNADVNCASCHERNVKVEHIDKPARTTSTGQPITCDTCHGNTNQAVKDAIAASNDKCSACHAYPNTKHQPTHATTVFTNDPTRADSGTCVTCHGNTNLQTLHVGKATTAGETMDCNTCHASTTPAVVTAINTKQTASCEACHILHAPKDATVVHDTTDVYAATIDTDCATCHERNVKKEHVDNPARTTSTGQAITCNTCHSSTNQMVIDAIAANNTKCDACHTLPPSKHNPTHTASVFTSDTARTDLATCSLCHVKSLTSQHVGKVTTAGVTMDCKTCHSATAAANVKQAIAEKNDNCEACHTVHAPQAAVAPHNSTAVYVDNADVNCASCHERNVKEEHIDNPARTASTGQPITCDTCHGNTNQAVKDAIAASNDKCSACHSYPTTNHQPQHVTNVYTTDTSRTDDCSMCHTTKNLNTLHVGVTKSSGEVMDCNTCHTSTDPKVVSAITNKQTNSCEACHTLHPVKDVTTIHDSVNFTSKTYDADMSCSACHTQYLNTEHVNKTTEAGVTMTCDTCHKSSRTDVQTAIATNNKKCEACHTKVHTSSDPQHATTFVTNKTMACEKCHNANSIADDHANYKTTGALGTTAGQTITCATCHNSSNTSVKNAIRTSNTMCDACHTTRHSDVQGPHKTTFFRETTSRCMSCHDPLGIKYSLSTTTNIAYHKVVENSVYYPTGISLTSTSTATDGGAFLTGYSRTTNLTCKGCHDTADGTATGATYSRLLKAPYGTNTTRSTTTHLCFKCHSSSFSGSAFSDHLDSHHVNAPCMTCHSTKIHSQSGRRHFIVLQGGEGSAYNSSTFRYGLRGFTHSTYGYSKSNCSVTCNGSTSH